MSRSTLLIKQGLGIAIRVRIGQGKKNACEFLKDNSNTYDEIESQIRSQLLNESIESDEDDKVTPIANFQDS